ncbi:MAG: DUF3081 domain-containing protein [Shewanella psychromarinicola]|jgi:hypothetical protein|uniref:DUF3081 domain-containing protein n=1 Tax=Shewanella psychromarinicola TaxID=2487742 RepID=A0A3N4EW27_9GAMM|nr:MULTISPECIES: DUF3081 domain-containing protein [Shewanella]AZG34971.1 DUF3081 domain-containing protein [Shewanella psychromarinicola]MCL1080606.1 DUF3081 domain-containing protein [Shewanella psychromarinicola]PKG79966.1 DUF3081 domain-containing protein [Shewanella sp. Actino-trap-3]RPA33234.1 DUF3081 domain-containing protein [Shewanella psychromarinicola]|tara:strand:+ start:66441 stop:66725 length:285 start_codon:yes stop_codon:yes gene_type:complete
MKNEIDIHRALKVFNKVTQHGEKRAIEDGHFGHDYWLCGISAQTDHDGYTITLSDAQVSLTVFFHNKYQFEYPTSDALDNFLRRFNDVENYQAS